MQIETTRFGCLEVESESLVLLPEGLAGFESLRHWGILREANSNSVGWLQSVSDPAVAIPVVTPQRYVENYELKFFRSELASLPWHPDDATLVLAVVSRTAGQFTLNLKAPVLINLDRRLGRQILASDDQPLQYAIPNQLSPLRKSA